MELSMTLRFDKLKFVKKLQESGQDVAQAEALADAIDEALEQSQSPLATKSDLKDLEVKLTTEMYKMAGLILAGVGILMGLMKLIN
ncbi:hypothetical protein [Actinobacillus porcinus]|uniref:DUF1640 domain-containing protein n=1 Tax=Actinobacillus porcinus TaxID=51048 RepID=A0ABY6TLU7_9PAST|nr:hypothetical protein [Actinobacillus porcinus]MDY5421647.1 hypothetical protein [Actinobacillus porcinus]VFY93918.1 Uncharacterised protein [Actinobacillus porcinus]VTU09379.1 Uncharacterised protein [Actinobacillus porcinus]